MIYYHVLEHLDVQRDVEGAGTHWSELTEQDAFCDSGAVISFSNRCSFHQDLDRLFEGTSHERASVGSIDTVTSDSHEVSAIRHHVHEQGQMSVIDTRTSKLDDVPHFAQQRLSCSFDTQNFEDFYTVV